MADQGDPSRKEKVRGSGMQAESRYEQLRSRGLRLFSEGRLEEAKESLQAALREAQGALATEVVERAWCNVCAVSTELGDTGEPVNRLGRILLQSRDRANRRFAAYHLARAYQLRCDVKKALFYARIAKEHAEELASAEWVAASQNQIGLLLIGNSQFAEASAELRGGLSTEPSISPLLRALLEDNLGYALAVGGDLEGSFKVLYRSLKTIRRMNARFYELAPRLSLSFAHLEADKPRWALRHGAKAYLLARRSKSKNGTKIALFLLGEAAKQLGRDLDARRYFLRMQEKFYPEQPDLTDLLLVIDARSLVNLKATV